MKKPGPFAQVALLNALNVAIGDRILTFPAGYSTLSDYLNERVTKEELAAMPCSGVTH